jgi:hypothetical protein
MNGTSQKETLATLRDALANAVVEQIGNVRADVLRASDRMSEVLRAGVLENGRLIAARRLQADLERMTDELERVMTGRAEP